MQNGPHRWRRAARRLLALQQAAGHAGPRALALDEQDAVDERLGAVEQETGTTLPASYKEFMRTYDGWPRVFRDSSLLSSGELASPDREARKAAALDELNTPLASFVAPLSAHWRDHQVMLLGLDEGADVVFVFDLEATDAHGEMEVVSWIAGLGMRHACFSDLLEFLADLLEASLPTETSARAA